MNKIYPPEKFYYGDLLYIEDYDVFCHSDLGNEIQNAIRSQLTDIICQFDFGFQDGGCLMLAKALEKWSNNNLELYYIANGRIPDIVQHVVACYKDKIFIDSDGIGSERDFLKKSDLLEAIIEPQMKKIEENTNLSGIVNDENYINYLVSNLEAKLGMFEKLQFEEILSNSTELPLRRGIK